MLIVGAVLAPLGLIINVVTAWWKVMATEKKQNEGRIFGRRLKRTLGAGENTNDANAIGSMALIVVGSVLLSVGWAGLVGTLAGQRSGLDRGYIKPQNGVLLVPAAGEPTFFVRKSVPRAAAESPLEVRGFAGRRELYAELQRLAAGARVGLAMDVTPAATMAAVVAATGLEVADVGPTLRVLRAKKSEWEQQQLRGAARQIRTLFEGIAEEIRPGLSELELTVRFLSRHR